MGHERPILVLLLQEHFLQIVQEAPAQGGRLQAGGIGVQQAAFGRCLQWCAMTASDRPVRSLNRVAATPSFRRKAFSMNSKGSSSGPTCRLSARWLPSRGGGLHPGFRVAQARLAHDAIMERQLAMRARTDAQVVAEFPVIQVMTATRARPGVGGHLVARQARRGQLGFDRPAWRRWYRRPANPRRELGEHRVRLHRQVIERQMLGAEGQRRRRSSVQAASVWPGKANIRSVDARHGALRHLDRGAGLGGVVDAAQLLSWTSSKLWMPSESASRRWRHSPGSGWPRRCRGWLPS